MKSSKIQLYIATTLDGFIAREDGSLDWLFAMDNPGKTDHGYQKFLDGIDTIVLGRKTYEVVTGFDMAWPYAGFRTFVITQTAGYSLTTQNTFLQPVIDKAFVDDLKNGSEKHIWLVGGGEVITAFLNLEAIDEMIICLIPLILGKGIPLFPNAPVENHFELLGTEQFDTGVVNLCYRRKEVISAG